MASVNLRRSRQIFPGKSCVVARHVLFPGKCRVSRFFSPRILFREKCRVFVRVLTILTLLLRVKERTKGWVKIKGKTVLRCCLCVFQFERAGFLNTVLFPGKILLVMFFSSCSLSRKCQVLYYFFFFTLSLRVKEKTQKDGFK